MSVGPRMKLNQLRNIAAIAEYGSLRAASRRLGMAQPVLTRSVGELERELGTILFERSARGMTLTCTGRVFLRRANAILNDVRRAQEELDQLQGNPRGNVVAGLSIVPHLSMLPHVLKPFRTRYSDVSLEIIEGFYPSLESGLRDGTVDFYIGPLPKDALSAELTQEKLFDNVLVVIGRKGHPLSNARSLKELVDAEWAATSATQKAEDELNEVFSRHSLPRPRLVMKSQSTMTLAVLLVNTDLLAMMPIQWTTSSITHPHLISIPIKETLSGPPIVIVRRAGFPLTPASEYFVDLCRRQNFKTDDHQPSATRPKSLVLAHTMGK